MEACGAFALPVHERARRSGLVLEWRGACAPSAAGTADATEARLDTITDAKAAAACEAYTAPT